MKEKNPFQKFLLALLITVIISLIGMGIIKKSQFYESSERNFFSFNAMLRYALFDYPVDTVSNFSKDLALFWDSRYEKDLLRKQISSNHVLEARIKELEQEVYELRDLNNLDSLYSDYDMISGQVLNRSMERWDEAVTINLGKKDGVDVDDAVVNHLGLIGRVIEVNDHNSVVSLITANNEYSQIAVKLQHNEKESTAGILSSYDLEEQFFSVKLLESRASVQEGMMVVTSGQGGIFPSGFYLGRVHSVKKVADSVGIIVYVDSDVDFNNLKYISVVKKK